MQGHLVKTKMLLLMLDTQYYIGLKHLHECYHLSS